MRLYGDCGTFEAGIAGVGNGTTEGIYVNPDPDGTVDYSKATITANWIKVCDNAGGTITNGLFEATANLSADAFIFKNGSSGGKTNDNQYYAHTNNSVYRGFYGGTCYYGAIAGGFCLNLNNAVSHTSRALGCRLVFVP
jgi:hypothetical protein